jgi:hypothetical protein
MQELPDKSGISLILVQNEKELERYNVDLIARSLWGGDVPRMYPIYLVFYDGTLRVYFEAV